MAVIYRWAKFFICFVLIHGIDSQGSPTNLLRFLYLANGNFSNKAQVSSGIQADGIRGRLVPVRLPKLSELTMLFFEEYDKDRIIRRQLGRLFSVGEDVVNMTMYNITDNTQYKPGEYKLSNLNTLKPEDLKTRDDCNCTFEFHGPRYVSGTWQTCFEDVSSTPVFYSVTFMCEFFTVTMPSSVDETSTSTPYYNDYYGDKYPVPDAPADINPCSNTC